MSILDKHGVIERNATLLLVGSLLVVSIGGIVEIAPLFYLENTIEKVEGMRPYTPLELAGGAYLTEQGETQISANDYIGKSVYTAADESIGNVTNLIMEQDGGLVAAVIGVGGFLGIGAKDVAVPMDKVTMTRNAQDGTIRLTTTETAETLKAAPVALAFQG